MLLDIHIIYIDSFLSNEQIWCAMIDCLSVWMLTDKYYNYMLHLHELFFLWYLRCDKFIFSLPQELHWYFFPLCFDWIWLWRLLLCDALNPHTVCAEQFATKRFPCFLHEFFVKLDSWWQFWNLLVMRIPKHPLHV